MIEIFKRAGGHDQAKVADDGLNLVAGMYIDERQQGELQSQLWGFLARCLSGGATTMSNEAAQLSGLGAWRWTVRQIHSGMGTRLAALGRGVRVIHLEPINGLETVHVGVAEFEEEVREFQEAGGAGFSGDPSLKADLLAILFA